jgi:hypothetical protein
MESSGCRRTFLLQVEHLHFVDTDCFGGGNGRGVAETLKGEEGMYVDDAADGAAVGLLADTGLKECWYMFVWFGGRSSCYKYIM